jgi:WXG100 family type VII secretion target
MTSFAVNHGGMSDVGDQFAQAATQAKQVIDDLDRVLARISQASQGQATPLWEEQQRSWDQSADQMYTRLTGHHASHVAIAEHFHSGDRMGAQIMHNG